MKPQFGDWLENVMAGDGNPHKRGRFVRVVRVPRGRMNAGLWWEMTDGRGDFWQSNPESCIAARAPEQLLNEQRRALRKGLDQAVHRMASVAGRLRLDPPYSQDEMRSDGDYLAELLSDFRSLIAAASPNRMDGEGGA